MHFALKIVETIELFLGWYLGLKSKKTQLKKDMLKHLPQEQMLMLVVNN